MMTVGGPAQPLVDAQQRVGEDHPLPRWREYHQERHRQSDQPAGHENALVADAVAHAPREQIRQRLDNAEADDERHDDSRGRLPKIVGREQRHDGSLQADHRADERVDQHQ
jgi:hypothetical protein